jgi:hypothetical protein
VSEQIDAFLLNRSRQKPATEATEQENFCVRPAYVLTDWPVMQALARAADRVKVRIYLTET